MKQLFIILTILLYLSSCSDESRIEGLVFSDKIQVVTANKEISIIQNSSNQTVIDVLKLNDKNYSYSVNYYQGTTAGNVYNYLAMITMGAPMGIAQTNGGAAYNIPQGEEININSNFNSSGLVMFYSQNGNLSNTAANTIKLDEPFYLTFKMKNNLDSEIYGWIKISISTSKITIMSYGYRTGKTLKAGEM